MKTNPDGSFTEANSLELIQDMIQTSRRHFRSDSILIILWGWVMSLSYGLFYSLTLFSQIYVPFWVRQGMIYAANGLVLFGLVFTGVFIYRKQASVQTYIGISLRYVWISVVAGSILINLIQFNVLEAFNPELQHPILMVLTAFAIVVSGGILRFTLLVYGGIVFGLLAYICSYLPLEAQLLFEAIAWFVAFVIPGHVLYARRNQ